jgi:cyclopropane-fatty-acyl-phospholipid synthase
MSETAAGFERARDENPGASGDAISVHYDVRPEFWVRWLGETMAYSCALFEGTDQLDEAQRRKIDWHLDRAGAVPGATVLDIGCGWGSLLQRALAHRTVGRAVGLTLSQAQVEHVARAVPGAEVHGVGWADFAPAAPFDAIVSIGAFEHFARPDVAREEKIEGYQRFFRRCWEWSKPGSRLSLQTIAYDVGQPTRKNAFMQTEIYPESELPYLDEILEAAAPFYEVTEILNHRAHYIRTCEAWMDSFRRARKELLALVGAEVVKRYDTYLRCCIIGFKLRHVVLLRLAFERLDAPAQIGTTASSE